MTIGSLVSVGAALASTFFFMGVGNKHSTFTINNTSDFINFANSVNNGTSYLGTTVLLNSDVDFSEELSKEFGSIGKYPPNYFNGTFDGQGHIISNLIINSVSSFTGLFGYSEGLTIKNVVLDNSCSITSSYSSPNNVYIGGIVGHCWTGRGQCSIENSINMASVTFSRNAKSGDLCLGGIAGEIRSPHHSTYTVIAKNCANYGSITHSGESVRSYIGGIVGSSSNYSVYEYIQNCFNHGTITHSGTTSKELHIGGITGYSRYTYVENCLSAGKISASEPWRSKIKRIVPLISRYQKYIGSIVGSADPKTNIKYCFWTSDVGIKKIYGNGKPSLTETPATSPVIPSDAVNELNIQVSSNSGNNWNKWIHNPNRRNISFVINGNKFLSISSQAILLPNLASSNVFKFDGWYTDPGYSKLFADNTITSDKDLYGIYNKKVVVKFYSNIWNIFRKLVPTIVLSICIYNKVFRRKSVNFSPMKKTLLLLCIIRILNFWGYVHELFLKAN